MKNQWLALALLPLLLLACEGEQYTSPGTGGGGGGGAQAGGGAYTGILLNAQRPPSETPFKGTLTKWTVADAAGNVLFTSDQVPETGTKGANWQTRRSEATSISTNMWLGKNPYEVKVVRDQFSDDYKTGTFTVSDATAAELRGMSNLTSLLSKANLVVLVGKMGQ